MANFEGLIRQALAGQNASDPAIRNGIYKSSRNALARMLEKSGNTGDETVRLQFGRLEQSIALIEAEYAPAPAEAPPQAMEPVAPPATPPAPPPSVIEPEDVYTSFEQPLADTNAPPPAPETASVPAPEQPQARPSEPIATSTPASLPPQTPSTGLPPDYQPKPLFPPTGGVEQDAGNPEPAPVGSLVRPSGTNADVIPPRQERDVPFFDVAETPSQQASPQQPPLQHGNTPPERMEPAAYHQPEPSQPSVRGQAFEVGGFDGNSEIGRAEGNQSIDPALDEIERQFGTAESPAHDRPVEAYLGDIAPESQAETPYGQPVNDELSAERNLPPTYKRKHPLLRRIWPIFLALAVLLVILWIMYAMLANRDGNGLSADQAANGGAAQSEDGSTFITLLQPTDLSALVTAGRGTAELITEQKRQMLRLKSTRKDGSPEVNAEPILLELERGVLRQINGKDVTVEFYAKSGGNGPAQFAIQCDIGGDSVCGRKRFRVGLQPERILFSLDLTDGISTDERAYLAINTDITNAAETTRSGDEIDIIHVRLRFDENGS